MTNTIIAPNPQDSAASEPPPETLDKVRDILFGGQMRAVESRLQGLEARLLQAQENLRAEFTKQIDTLDAVVQKRVEELKALAGELKEVLRDHEQRHLSLEATMGTADAELREGILQQGKAVAAEIARLAERLTSELVRSVEELQEDKASRSSLSALFTDLATRLTEEGAGRAKMPQGVTRG